MLFRSAFFFLVKRQHLGFYIKAIVTIMSKKGANVTAITDTVNLGQFFYTSYFFYRIR